MHALRTAIGQSANSNLDSSFLSKHSHKKGRVSTSMNEALSLSKEFGKPKDSNKEDQQERIKVLYDKIMKLRDKKRQCIDTLKTFKEVNRK